MDHISKTANRGEKLEIMGQYCSIVQLFWFVIPRIFPTLCPVGRKLTGKPRRWLSLHTPSTESVVVCRLLSLCPDDRVVPGVRVTASVLLFSKKIALLVC